MNVRRGHGTVSVLYQHYDDSKRKTRTENKAPFFDSDNVHTRGVYTCLQQCSVVEMPSHRLRLELCHLHMHTLMFKVTAARVAMQLQWNLLLTFEG